MSKTYSSADLLDKADQLFQSIGTDEVVLAVALEKMGVSTDKQDEDGERLIEQLTSYDLLVVDIQKQSVRLSSLSLRLIQDSWSQRGYVNDGNLLGPSEAATFGVM